MIKPLIASLLLTGCTSAVKLHVPIECLPVPSHSVTFTDAEVNVLNKAVLDDGTLVDNGKTLLDKFQIIAETYKARIRANCELIEVHNQLHEDNK